MNLTDRAALSAPLPPGKSDVIVFDEKLAGFGLRIRSGGKRSWVAQYRFGKQQRRFNLGSIHAVTAAKARDQASKIFAKVALGIDPQAERMSAVEKAGDLFETLGKSYLKAVKPALRPGSYDQVQRHIEKYLAPLGRKSIHSITRKDVAARIREIADTSGVVTANRARSTLSTVFSWAMAEGLVETNPVIGTNKAGEEAPRKRILADGELAEIWRACDRPDDFCVIVRLLMLTAQRREEVGGGRDSELDVAKRQWLLPPERTKNGREHLVPLSDAALALLEAHPRRKGRDLLFGDADARSFSGWSRAREALDGRIAAARIEANNPAVMPPWTLHDLRRTAATGMANLGTLPHVVEAVLNHQLSRSGVAGVYNLASYLPEKRQALELWAAHVGGLIAGEPSNIVSLREA